MTTIQALLIFYYVFSVIFEVGYIVENDNVHRHPWAAVAAIILSFIVAPVFFPFNLGSTIKRME